jgi:hypothetical protein
MLEIESLRPIISTAWRLPERRTGEMGSVKTLDQAARGHVSGEPQREGGEPACRADGRWETD